MEFFLADDILQGEDVPFYLLWDGENPKEIILGISGFDSIKELHNVAESSHEGQQYIIKKLHIKGYVGGILSTEITENPMIAGKLTIQFIPNEGETVHFEKIRKLYTTSIKMVDIPKKILLSPTFQEKITLLLKGKTTVFFDVEELPENECKIDLPKDLKETIEKIRDDIKIGFKDLELKFPQHKETLKLIIELEDSKQSIESIAQDLIDKIEKSFEDEKFAENLLMVFFTSVTKRLEGRRNLINSLQEYFESYTSLKAYFINPLLHIYLNEGDSCHFGIKIYAFDLNKKECGNPITISVQIKSDMNFQSPIKDLFIIERENND